MNVNATSVSDGFTPEEIPCAIYILTGGNDQRKFLLKRWLSFSVNVALLHHHVPICLGYPVFRAD